MRTITLIGWHPQSRSVVERVSFWPDEDEMTLHKAIAMAGQATDLMTIEEVLVENGETADTIEIPTEGHSIEDLKA